MVLGLSSELKVKVTSDKDCLQTLAVEMPAATVKEKIERAFEIVRGKVKLPGFRPGKAPIEVVKDKFKEAAYEEAQDLLLREGVGEALKQKKLTPVQTPQITNADFNPDKAFNFEFQVEVAPTFKIANYKGLKINKPVKKVSDQDVDKAVENIASMNARLVESKAETLANNHFAVINYEGTIDGKPIEGAKSDNFLMDMSAPQTIAGLAEGLVGAKAGEVRDIPVTFPEDSPAKELAGKKASFKVTLVAIKEKSTPTVDDEFAKDLGVESVADLKSKLRESLEREAEQGVKAEVDKQIIDRLLEGNQFAVPPTMVARQTEYLLSRQRERMTQQGMGKEDADKLIDRLKADAQKEAEREVRLAYLLNALAEAENITITDEDVKTRIAGLLERSQPQERAALEKALKGGYRERIESELRESKIFTWILDNAKVKEVAEEKK